ncbi:MAG: isoaspartyl peptidase/L-asparaginase [Ignavibacteria bacterium]|nr:isoaspartyl peptidase/L-asparaginase [Ignavibacteria bacterium]
MKSLAIHGGAGTITKANMTPELEAGYRHALGFALMRGWQVLEAGGTALDAVEAAVAEMELNPLFNAGKGSVFTHDGLIEMDASIMNGADLTAGAIAGVRNIKHPIKLARAVMDKSDFVMLSGKGAEQFAKEQGLEMESDEYFFTQRRFDQLQKAKESGKAYLDHTTDFKGGQKKFGTVGAVALDGDGNLAAATSTGGLTNKKYGRIGDTPIIGAGTYAENGVAAVSCTGDGEFFIRQSVAYDLIALMKYKELSLKEAAKYAIFNNLNSIKGEGGLIAVDTDGNIEMVFNSEGMYRASISQGREIDVKIYKD